MAAADTAPVPTTSRQQLAAALALLLPADIMIMPAPTSLDPLGNALAAALVLHRKSIKPAPASQGGYLEDFDLWVVVEGIDPDLTETALDAATDLVVEALDGITWLGWTAAERDQFDEQKPAYRIALSIASVKE
jgi:hypothetical protein